MLYRAEELDRVLANQNPSNEIDPYGLAPGWVGPAAISIGATGGLLFTTGAVGTALGVPAGPVVSGVGVGLMAIGGALQLWEIATTPEQIDEILESEDMEELKENIDKLQELLDKKNCS